MTRRLLSDLRRSALDRLTAHEFQFGDAHVRVHELWTMRPDLTRLVEVPTFVLVHGLGVSSRFFVPLADALAPHGRVLLFDLPGFDDLPRPRHRMSIVDFADVVKRALDELEVVDPVLVGHSMGSQVVTEILAQHPTYSPAAMLIGPVVVAGERSLPQVIKRFVQASAHEPPGNTFTASTAYLRAGARWIRDTMPKVIAYPIEERLPLTKARLVLVSGENDWVSPLAWREQLASTVPGARVVTIPRAAHGVVHDGYRELAAELLGLAGIGR